MGSSACHSHAGSRVAVIQTPSVLHRDSAPKEVQSISFVFNNGCFSASVLQHAVATVVIALLLLFTLPC